jgi:hypothetical protein
VSLEHGQRHRLHHAAGLLVGPEPVGPVQGKDDGAVAAQRGQRGILQPQRITLCAQRRVQRLTPRDAPVGVERRQQFQHRWRQLLVNVRGVVARVVLLA